MNRDALKKAIKKLVLQEITSNAFGTPDHKTDVAGAKAVEKVVGKDGRVITSVGTGKSVGDSPKHNIQFIKNSDADSYDVVSVTNDSERKTAKGLKLDDAVKFAKDHATETAKTYQEKARAKSINSGPATKEEKSDKKVDGGMSEVKEKTQKAIADKNDEKAEVENTKEFALNDKMTPPMGGELVDMLEKIIDKALKDKAEPKSAYLKVDADMVTPAKLTTKLSDTPAIKSKKK